VCFVKIGSETVLLYIRPKGISTRYFQFLPAISNFYPLFPISMRYFQFLPDISNFYPLFPISTRYFQFLPTISNFYALFPISTWYFQFLPDISNFYPLFPTSTRYFQFLPAISNFYPLFPNLFTQIGAVPCGRSPRDAVWLLRVALQIWAVTGVLHWRSKGCWLFVSVITTFSVRFRRNSVQEVYMLFSK
jgi:hypothetical protein